MLDKDIDSYIVQEDTLIRMPALYTPNKRKNLFLVHCVTGSMKGLQKISSVLPFNVWGFQYTKNAPTESIQALAKYYIQVSTSYN